MRTQTSKQSVERTLKTTVPSLRELKSRNGHAKRENKTGEAGYLPVVDFLRAFAQIVPGRAGTCFADFASRRPSGT